MPLETRRDRLLSRRRFLGRLVRYAGAAAVVTIGSLGAGMLGYHYIERLSWLDAFLNAAMILGGMGPVDPVRTRAGKAFAGCYALYCGVVALVVAGMLFTPIFHRLLHRFHLER